MLGMSCIQVSLVFPFDVPFHPKTSDVTAVWVFQLREKGISVRGGDAPARSKKFKMTTIRGFCTFTLCPPSSGSHSSRDSQGKGWG